MRRFVNIQTVAMRKLAILNQAESFWLGLQADYDREMAKEVLAKTLAKIKPWSGKQVDAASAA